MLILIFGSKSGFGDDFGQYDRKTIILHSLLVQTPLRNSIVMATPKVPGDQKLFERICYLLKLEVTKFQLPTPNGFLAVLYKPAWASKIGLKFVSINRSTVCTHQGHYPEKACFPKRVAIAMEFLTNFSNEHQNRLPVNHQQKNSAYYKGGQKQRI